MEYKAKELTWKVFEIIKEEWPVHASGVCRKLDIECNPSNISKIKYHFGILEGNGKIRTKKLDRALVAWPSEIEKLRVMHEFFKSV
jgi:hypothetical protein